MNFCFFVNFVRGSFALNATARGGRLPRLSATAASAASSRVFAKKMLFSFKETEVPTKFTTTGFPVWRAAASTSVATFGAGGLEISTMTLVSRSAARRRRPCSMVMPPTSWWRSWPPVPMACEIPAPWRCTRLVTCWVPVPEAPTTPTAPRRTALAKPSGMPSTIAVPQSGPMTRSFRSRAYFFREISSASDTLSLNSITLSPRRSAFIASAAAYSPGTEIKARFASGDCASAICRLRSGWAAGPPPAARSGPLSSAATAAEIAASSAAADLPRTATSRSFGLAATLASISPASRSRSRLAGVAITAEACSTPGIFASAADNCISDTESR